MNGTSHIIPRDPVTGEIDDETSLPADDAVERVAEAIWDSKGFDMPFHRLSADTKEMFRKYARAALQASQRELHCAQESTNAAISDYNDALGRIATLETALRRIRDNPAGADIVAQYALAQQQEKQ